MHYQKTLQFVQIVQMAGKRLWFFTKKLSLTTGQTHPSLLTILHLSTLTNEFLHPNGHLALSKNSVNSVKSVKTPGDHFATELAMTTIELTRIAIGI